MPGSYKKEDLRIIKTHKFLTNALVQLLMRRNFNRITVNDLCETAQISRATFYSHFKDKYDLLEYWGKTIKPTLIEDGILFHNLEKKVNAFIENYASVITNILDGANNETMEIVRVFMLSVLEATMGNTEEEEKPDSRYIVWSNFCTGGMIYCLLWQVKKRFPKNLKTVNEHFYDILNNLLEWKTNK